MSGTADLPNLVSGVVPDRFFPTTTARTATTVASTALDAANGVAVLDAQGLLKSDDLSTGEGLWVRWTPAGWPATRPTSRTDICVHAQAPSSISDPATWTANAPTWLILGDLFEIYDVPTDGTTPPPRGPLIGISMETPAGSTHDAEVTRHEGLIGRQVDLIHVYHLWDTAFPNTDEAARTAAGQSILYCWQTKRNGSSTAPTWAQIASGAEDAVIDANATRIKAMTGAPVYVNFQNEPELLIGTPGSGLLGTAAEFASAWRRIVDRFRAAGVTNVKWTWVVMGVMTTNQQNNAIALYPGDTYVDWIGFDPYNWAAARSGAWLSFPEIVQPWYDWARATLPGAGAKPFMLAEYGSVEDSAAPSLQDTFDGDLSMWPGSVGTTIVSGRARITCSTASNSLKSAPGYVFAGGNVTARVYPPVVGGAATSVTVTMRIDAPTSGTLLSIEANRVTGTLILASKAAFNDANQVTITYDPVAHAWWRIRESAGTVFWETSPDGTTWTNRRTTNAATPAWLSVTGQAVNFQSKRDSGTVDFAEIDSVSTVASAPPADTNRKASWLAGVQAANAAKTFPMLQALVYFDHIGSGGSTVTPDGWLLSSSAAVMPAYRAMVQAAL